MRSNFRTRGDATRGGTGSSELRSPGAGECRGHPDVGEIAHGGDAAAGLRFSFGIEAIRAGTKIDRGGGHRGAGDGLQSGNQPDDEHADDIVAGVYATSHDAGGSDCGGDDQRAYALRREKRIGSLEAGKQADLAVFEVEDYREIPYYFGMNRCWMTMKRGEIIYMRD